MSLDDRRAEEALGSSSAGSRPAALSQTFVIAFAVTAIAVYGASAVSPVLPDIATTFNVDAAQA
jgi:hypothetical protein